MESHIPAKTDEVPDFRVSNNDIMQQLLGINIGMIINWYSNNEPRWVNIKVNGFTVLLIKDPHADNWVLKVQFNDDCNDFNIPPEVVPKVIQFAKKLRSKLNSHNVEFVEELKKCFGTTPSIYDGYQIMQNLINNIH